MLTTRVKNKISYKLNYKIKKYYNNLYKNAIYFLTRKYEKFGSLSEKSGSVHSVNSGKENCNSNPEPSFNSGVIEGAETRHGEPKLENI